MNTGADGTDNGFVWALATSILPPRLRNLPSVRNFMSSIELWSHRFAITGGDEHVFSSSP